MDIVFMSLSGIYWFSSMFQSIKYKKILETEKTEKLNNAVKGVEILKIERTMSAPASVNFGPVGIPAGEVEIDDDEESIACVCLEKGLDHEFIDPKTYRKRMSSKKIQKLLAPLGPAKISEIMEEKPSVVNFHTIHPPVYRCFEPRTSKFFVGENRAKVIRRAAKSRRYPLTRTMFGVFIISSLYVYSERR